MTKGTPRRTVRIEAGLWDEAQQTAKRLGDNLSFIIRDRLREYIEGNPATARTVTAFLDADFVIPSHGGSMVPGFAETAEDAQRIIDKFTSPHDQEIP